MSKRRWKDICSLSSFRVSLLDKANLPDELTTNAGGIDPSYFPDSNIFNINTFAVEAGFTDAYDFKRRILTSSVWHAHQVPMRSHTVW